MYVYQILSKRLCNFCLFEELCLFICIYIAPFNLIYIVFNTCMPSFVQSSNNCLWYSLLSDFCFTSSTVAKRCPFMVFLILVKRKQSNCAMSGDYGSCGIDCHGHLRCFCTICKPHFHSYQTSLKTSATLSLCGTVYCVLYTQFNACCSVLYCSD